MENQGWANWPTAALPATCEASKPAENPAKPGLGAPPQGKSRAANGTGARLRLDSIPAVRRFLTTVVRDLKAGTISPDKARVLTYAAKEIAALFMAEAEMDVEARLAALEASSR